MPRTAGERATKPCANCGKLLTRLLSQAKSEHWYCTHACQVAHRPPAASVGKKHNPYRGQYETRPCAECGKPVTRYLNPERVARPWFCSYACSSRSRLVRQREDGTWTQGRKPRRGDTVPCAVCGTPFYRQPAYIKEGRRYCSPQCHHVAQRKEQITKPCAVCGTEMRLSPSQSARRYCSNPCEAIGKTTRHTGRTHNGRPVIEHVAGYYLIYEPTHPAAHKHNGRVLEHRWVVEQTLGRYLTADEQVDHINQDKKDNRLENLQVLSAHDHSVKTSVDRLREIQGLRAARAELEEYRRRFGPLG